MRLLPSDPDIETIVSRIQNSDLDLQPEFQRGEVWGKTKKQRLIDSILRDWHVPPIHIIENPQSKKLEVLDGQQRLAAIRDFVEGDFPVDGMIEPLDVEIQALDGLFYDDLPDSWKRQFNQFPIRLFRIVDYRGSEPGELFFRLNQPSSLTGAEQRNAFFGPVRQQIKDLVDFLIQTGLDKTYLGFSNSRMAYDDVLARAALVIERRSLAEKITSAELANLYRSEQPLSERTIALISEGMQTFAGSRQLVSYLPKFTKATLFSWLIFLVRAALFGAPQDAFEFAEFLEDFEILRTRTRYPQLPIQAASSKFPAGFLISIYESRSSSRVSDVSSVILRDAILWLFREDFGLRRKGLQGLGGLGIHRIHQALGENAPILGDDSLAKRLIEFGWGNLG